MRFLGCGEISVNFWLGTYANCATKISAEYLRHDTSSEPSAQSEARSHFQDNEMQVPSVQRNSLLVHDLKSNELQVCFVFRDSN